MKSISKNYKLSVCRRCNDKVFDRDIICPHCGKLWPSDSWPMWRKRVHAYSALLGVVLVALLLSGIWGGLTESKRKPPKAPKNDSSHQERMMCEEAIRASVNNPSTLKIHTFTGFGMNLDTTGTKRIVQRFSAKNAFGLEKTYDAFCSISPRGEMNFEMFEVGR